MKNNKNLKILYLIIFILSLSISLSSLAIICSQYSINDGLYSSYMVKNKKLLEKDFYDSNLFEYNILRPIAYWLGTSVNDEDEIIERYIARNTRTNYDEYSGKETEVKPTIEEAKKYEQAIKKSAINNLKELKNVRFFVLNTKTNEYYTNTGYKNVNEFNKNVKDYLNIQINKNNRGRSYTKESNVTNFRENNEIEYKLLDVIETEDIKVYASFKDPSNFTEYDRIKSNSIRYEDSIKMVEKCLLYLAINLIISIIAFIGYKKIKVNLFRNDSKIIKILKKIPTEFVILSVIIITTFSIGSASNLVNTIIYYPSELFSSMTFLVLSTLAFIISIYSINLRYQSFDSKKERMNSSIIMKLFLYISSEVKEIKKSYNKISLTKKIISIGILCLIINIFAWFLDMMVNAHVFTTMASLISVALIVFYICKKLAYLSEIIERTQEIKAGDINVKIPLKGDDNFTELAQNINNLGEGLEKSIDIQLKSERLKSELITNVSHDLKTPLTSIINYIELIKKEENIDPDHINDYIKVLDLKSKRLKILIEDLFEASKVGSGNIELNMTNIDVKQLLRQCIGEMNERLDEANLNIKLKMPNDSVYIYADGQRMYRVFENLLSNISKYSLQGTRVYIDLEENNETIKLSMKNISSYELNFGSEEIMERFKRADESRNTEGSGLGLAIAKDLVKLQGGKFNIEIDGDLFKSIIEFDKIEK